MRAACLPSSTTRRDETPFFRHRSGATSPGSGVPGTAQAAARYGRISFGDENVIEQGVEIARPSIPAADAVPRDGTIG
jgi:hypothetical protein